MTYVNKGELLRAALDAQSGVRGITIVVASNPYREGQA